MKPGVILAVLASLILIVGAAFTRYSQPKVGQNLVMVEQGVGEIDSYEELFANFDSATSTSTLAGNKEPVGGTDLIARQLMMDYINLASSGQATEANINDLAQKYVTSIPTLLSVSKLSYLDLNIVPDNQANLKKYADEAGSVYKEYAGKMLGAYSANALSLGPQNSAMSRKMSDIYLTTFNNLRKVSVPASLVDAHLGLINTYLENAAAMDSISQSESDPARAFAGIISISNNLDKESLALREIEKILNAKGI